MINRKFFVILGCSKSANEKQLMIRSKIRFGLLMDLDEDIQD